MMKIFIITVIMSLTSGTPSSGAELRFADNSTFQNFVVTAVHPNGEEHLLHKKDDLFVLDLDDYQVGDTFIFGIQFFVPNDAGSESFEVRGATRMQVNVRVTLTNSLVKTDTTIPVYYFDSIGRRGFDQIDPVPELVTDRLFEQYFKAALMAQHYYLRMRTYDSPEYRRAFKLWRDSSYTLATRKLDWWDMTIDIPRAAQSAFPETSPTRQATELYFEEARTK